MASGPAPRAAAKVPFLVRIEQSLKQRLTKLAFKRSWSENRRCSENSLVENAIRLYLDAEEKRR